MNTTTSITPRRRLLQVIGVALALLCVWALPMSAQDDVAGDRAALMALYEATEGDNWTNNENWGSDKPLHEWYGVKTNSSRQVTELELGGNELQGSMPAALGDLANIENLFLGSNQLSGEIPPALGDLANLRLLELRGNQLSGEIPPALGDLANLEYLWLGGNQLSGEIPLRWVTWPTLEIFFSMAMS